ERPVQVEDPRVALAVEVELRDVLAPDEDRRVLVVRIDRRHDTDTGAVALRELLGDHGEVLVARAELLLQAEATNGAEVAFDVDAEHLLELASQMARQEMERLLEHRAAVDGVERV